MHAVGDGWTHVEFAGKKGGRTFGPCPHSPRPSLKSAESYYSDWSVYAQTTSGDDASFSAMKSTWKVPASPSSRGPLGLSSVYIFNGLEDGAGHHGNASLILQPVLQFGKSGCLLNPLAWNQWHLTAYLVDGNGRAHCGSVLKVEENDTVVGTMTQASSGEWTVEAILVGETNRSSSYSASLGTKIIDAAYLTLEGMVIYNCATYPPGGGITFTDVGVTRKEAVGAQKRFSSSGWVPEIRHSECHQNVKVIANDQVELLWDSDA